jgi:HEPN domain-containing protein
MPPRNSRDFIRIAEQRYNAAEALFRADFTLDAQYVAGYVVECSLKALILETTPESDRNEKLRRITSGATMHLPETLLQELRIVGVRLTQELAKRMRRFDWTVDLRYETGRRSRGETQGLLKTSIAVRDWVKEQLS